MALISTNQYLTRDQGLDNAQYIFDFFTMHPVQPWTPQAVSAMLGNMFVESTINPGIWQGRDEFDYSGGFGLTQWTPATKYIDWAATIGASDYAAYKLIDPQCQRIAYELSNGLQWQETQGMSFLDFATSTKDVRYLSDRFCWGYEIPADPDLVLRADMGEFYFKLFTVKKKKSKWIYMMKKPQLI